MSFCNAYTKTGGVCKKKAIKGACMCCVHQCQDDSPLTNQTSVLFSLPEHLLEKIVACLSVKEKSALAPVCRYFKRKQPTKQQKMRYIIKRDINIVQDASADTGFDNSIIYNNHEKKFVIYCKIDKIPHITFSKTYFYIYDSNILHVSPSEVKISQDEFCDRFVEYMFPHREVMRLRNEPCGIEIISSVTTSQKLFNLKYPAKLFKMYLDFRLIQENPYI